MSERICDFNIHQWIQSESKNKKNLKFVCDGNAVASLLQLVFEIEIPFMLINHTLQRETIRAVMIFHINVGFSLPFTLNHFIQTKVFKNPNSTVIFFFNLADQTDEKEKGKTPFFCERNLKNKQWFKFLQPFFCWCFQIGYFCSPSTRIKYCLTHPHLGQYAHAHTNEMHRCFKRCPTYLKNYSG